MFLSNIGKLITQHGAHLDEYRFKSSPIFLIKLLILKLTTEAFPAPKKSKSSLFKSSSATKEFIVSLLRNLRIGDCNPFSISFLIITFIYARPFAPSLETNLVYSSIWPLDREFPPGIFKATTLELLSFAGSAKTLNSSSLTNSDISTNFKGILKSGLSQP